MYIYIWVIGPRYLMGNLNRMKIMKTGEWICIPTWCDNDSMEMEMDIVMPCKQAIGQDYQQNMFWNDLLLAPTSIAGFESYEDFLNWGVTPKMITYRGKSYSNG